ncbi:TAT-variant-translocated molybdopterin oxidoreductase [Lutibacter sp.]|uniref:TAT-variant-translocated molybdopterin oxidoreductase n=1 Tax=Lutibacter sp. TaxID=1925666 RepID=UPI0025BB8B45|nr:TAT-variant-translocated molybdopterin oxidoreductase [Lutibacter sp.]MCF6181950.1 TAT-variant-translocated molybdopterin oxidoreductase [Lutibacter sp.]
MASNKKYWRSVEELKADSPIVESLQQKEFAEELPTDAFLGDKENLSKPSTTRRDFLKYVGFSTAAVTLAACEGPVIKSIPYVVKPDNIIPGVANYYASTMVDGTDFANILVKVREGRPIKIEPNKMAGNWGTTSARVQASVLSLYDNNRLRNPLMETKESDWKSIDKKVIETLKGLKDTDKKIVVLSGTTASPSSNKVIEDFTKAYGNVSYVVYDALSESAALDAFQEVYGVRALPDYKFENAEVIVSVGADFLGDWQGGHYSAAYAKGRKPVNGKMSKLIQFESNMSLTGANADKRIPVKPSNQVYALLNLYNAVTGNNVKSKEIAADKAVKIAAEQLKKVGKNAVVVTGIQNKEAQLIAMAINKALQSEIMDATSPRFVKAGDDKAVANLVKEMNKGKIGALLMYNVNPSYTLPNAKEFNTGLKKVKLSVTFDSSNTETALNTNIIAITPHYLEAWGDSTFQTGQYALMQPTIRPLFNTRQFEDSLLTWMDSNISYYDYIRENWTTSILNGSSWNKALEDGIFKTESKVEVSENTIDVNKAASSLLAVVNPSDFELNVYVKTTLGDGKQANNPWLQELPDPISRTSWDNYLTISAEDAKVLNFENWNVSDGALNGSRANIKVGDVTIKNVPVFIQPGQAKGSVGMAVGYGRTSGMQKEMMVGLNAFSLMQEFNPFQKVEIEKTEGEHEFACVQLQHTIMGRDEIIKETTLDDFINKPKEDWNKTPEYSLNHEEVPAERVDLWEKFDDTIGPHFNLSIDLATCTGCAACIVACHAENNVPVVGKHEIRVSRDMYWLRIDRYYTSDMTNEVAKEEGIFGSGEMFNEMMVPQENPQVAFQPVMCQHCNHAPCETVCPVAATSHGRQGQNQMIYNRCIGTRYCANNCPYKVRRFNWFKYAENSEFDFNMNNDLGRMVLNPDVVIRSRGVMEKCSMCIQKTQLSILTAKKEGRLVKDEEFQTACSSACPTGAIVFGDINDKESEVIHLIKDDRTFHLLAEVGTKPNVMYHLKVRNTEES